MARHMLPSVALGLGLGLGDAMMRPVASIDIPCVQPGQFSLSHLNVNGITSHLRHIEQDIFLKATDVMCYRDASV